jgi:hypothetical protein
MKKTLLIIALMLSKIIAFSQTAVDFTANDCSGTSHHLFAEINAGKVIVIAFVMPCSMCASPSLSAYNTVQGYASPNVIFYLCDDAGNTVCSTLNTWANTNGMSGVKTFSNASVSQADYGSGGMPKIIVLGGGAHTVFYNENGGANPSGLAPAINAAIVAAGIFENNNADFKLNMFPNPTSEMMSVKYTLTSASTVGIAIYNMLGAKVKIIDSEKQDAGKHETQIDIDALSNGVYFLKLKVGDAIETKKITVAK